MPSLSVLAIVLGALAIVSRLPGIFHPKEWSKFVKSMLKDDHSLRLLAVWPFVLGVLILLNKHDFTNDLESIMSVAGWLMLVAATCVMWWPKAVYKKVMKLLKDKGMVSFICLLGVAAGVGLLYLGFYVY